MFTIRPFAEGDATATFGAVHGPDRDAPRRARTFVAQQGDDLVGAGTVMWSNRHPDVVSAFVDVDGSWRRRGIGSALIERLEAEARAPIVCNVERSDATTGFLTSRGLHVVVTSVTARIGVGEALAALDEVATDLPADVEVTAEDGVTAEVAAFADRVYGARHTWAGRYTPPPGAPWIGFAGATLPIDGAVQVARRDGEVVGVVSLHGGDFAAGADAFIAPTSVLDGSLDERVRLLAHLVRAALGAARATGVEAANVEYDTPYDDLVALVARIPSTVVSTREAWMRPAT